MLPDQTFIDHKSQWVGVVARVAWGKWESEMMLKTYVTYIINQLLFNNISLGEV